MEEKRMAPSPYDTAPPPHYPDYSQQPYPRQPQPQYYPQPGYALQQPLLQPQPLVNNVVLVAPAPTQHTTVTNVMVGGSEGSGTCPVCCEGYFTDTGYTYLRRFYRICCFLWRILVSCGCMDYRED